MQSPPFLAKGRLKRLSSVSLLESGLTVEMKVNPDSSRDTKILATTSAYFRSITTNSISDR
jgi:hypothetical protein